MTKKDFVFIAKVIRTLPFQSREDAALAFANKLPETNKDFSRVKFMSKCGVLKGILPPTPVLECICVHCGNNYNGSFIHHYRDSDKGICVEEILDTCAG
jgi:hypothetical protein